MRPDLKRYLTEQVDGPLVDQPMERWKFWVGLAICLAIAAAGTLYGFLTR